MKASEEINLYNFAIKRPIRTLIIMIVIALTIGLAIGEIELVLPLLALLLFLVLGCEKPEWLLYCWLFLVTFRASPLISKWLFTLEHSLELGFFHPLVSDYPFIAMILIVLLQIGVSKRHLNRLRLEPETILFAILGLFSIGIGFIYGGSNLFSDYRLYLYSLMIPAVALTISSRKQLRRVTFVFFTFTFIAGLLALSRIFFFKGGLQQLYIGFMPRKMVFLSAVICLVLVLNKTNRLFPHRFLYPGTLCLLTLQLINKSRKYYFGLGILPILLVVIGQLNWKRVLIFGIIGFFILTPFLSSSELMAELRNRITSPVRNWGEEASLNWRIYAWSQSWTRFLERPVLGYGTGRHIGSTKYLSGSIKAGSKVIYKTGAPHNMFLTVLELGGLLGFIPFLYILFRVAFIGWASYSNAKIEEYRTLYLGLLLGYLMFLGVFMIERFTVIAIMQLWFLSGLVVAGYNIDLGEDYEDRIS